MFNDNNILNYTSNCRQKIAQQTFDMVSGGSVYNPVVKNINTVNEVPTFAVGVGLTVPTHPSEYEINAIDMLYGSRISTQQQPPNTIDSLYGKREEILVMEKNCNRRGENGKFRYSEIQITTYINSNFIKDDCMITLFFDTYSYNPKWGYAPVSYPISIDIKDCCIDFSKRLYCAKSDKELNNSFNMFGKCVLKKIRNKINELRKNNPKIFETVIPTYTIPFKSPLIQLHERISVLTNDIIKSRNNFLSNSDYLKEVSSGYNTDNQMSCFCKEGGEPVYCCFPGLDPEKCKCSDGSLKNLCNGSEVDMEFILHYGFYYQSFNHPNAGSNCSGNVFRDDNINELNYYITDIKGNNLKSGSINYQDVIIDKSQTEYKFKIKIPTCSDVNIKIELKLGCAVCCPDNKIRIDQPFVFELKNFNYNRDFDSKTDAEKLAIQKIIFIKYEGFLVSDFQDRSQYDDSVCKQC